MEFRISISNQHSKIQKVTCMKIIKSTFIVLLLQTLALLGDVKFDFTYADAPGKGFHARPQAKAALEEVAKKIGSRWLKLHNARIAIKVVSEENAKACSDSLYISIGDEYRNGLLYSSVQEKILLGVKDVNTDNDFDNDKEIANEFDGTFYINFACPFSFNDDVSDNEFDFKGLVIHKITQLLGFWSSNLHNSKSEDEDLEQLVVALLQLGIEKLSGTTESKLEEESIKKQLLALTDFKDKPNDKFYDEIFHRTLLDEPVLESLNYIISFAIDSIENVEDNEDDISATRNLIRGELKLTEEDEINFDELLQLFVARLSESTFTVFDKFLTFKNGDRVFAKEKTLKAIRSDFQKNIQESDLYFNGMLTLSKVGSNVLLDKHRCCFLLNKKSIMSHFWSQKGLRPRKWDEQTTAILLDLGYRVNNRLARKWKSQAYNKDLCDLKQKIDEELPKVRAKVKKTVNKKLKKLKEKMAEKLLGL